MSNSAPVAPASTGAYGLQPPSLADARGALARVHPGTVEHVWGRLVTSAGLTGGETGREAFERLLAVMSASTDPVTSLCARALRIRLASYDRLSAAYATAHRPSDPGSIA